MVPSELADESNAGVTDAPKRAKKAKGGKERKVHEAGGIIICDGTIVLRLTDEQRWIFPKGKLKKHETPSDAAIREAVEETGLEVEIVEPAAEFVMRHEGKKRRFAFFLMRATAKTWDWQHHEGRDTFLIEPSRVGSLLRRKGYRELWEQSRERAEELCREPGTPRAAGTPGGAPMRYVPDPPSPEPGPPEPAPQPPSPEPPDPIEVTSS
jgi:8-oxo-dGTP pyrophosphatase MutT (NUDIX family)